MLPATAGEQFMGNEEGVSPEQMGKQQFLITDKKQFYSVKLNNIKKHVNKIVQMVIE